MLCLISDSFSKIDYKRSKRPLDFPDWHCKRLQILLDWGRYKGNTVKVHFAKSF
jgi:hypothetical protein